jgi:sarcosine oxidase
MPRLYDACVVGLGAMGSAATYQLARRGLRVIGIDSHAPPHIGGSTHGRTRIIREAYFEHPLYVPLVQRAYECWAELEQESSRTLFTRTGGLMIGPPDGELVSGTLASAREHRLPHEELTAGRIRDRFPGYDPSDDMVGVYEPRAGLLFPELCVSTFLERAAHHGAVLRLSEPARRWESDEHEVMVTTAVASYRARHLVLAAGPWMPELLRDLYLPLEVERQLFHWFEPRGHPDWFRAERSPIALWEFARGRLVATCPDVGHGIKVGIHHEGEITDPIRVRRDVTEEETARVHELLERLMPLAAGRLLDATTCLYTNTPDDHFLIDFHPRHPRVVIASPCSGHGFKFSSAIGEILAGLVTEGSSRFDLSPFRIARFDRASRATFAAGTS